MASTSPGCSSPSEPFLSSWKWFGRRVWFNSLLPAEAPGWLVLSGIARDHSEVIISSSGGGTLGEALNGDTVDVLLTQAGQPLPCSQLSSRPALLVGVNPRPIKS